MRIAQRLYEGIDIGGDTVGLITYMRTDGVQMAPEAITAARNLIANDYGKDYVPNAPREYQTKSKNAQEAHEAIRPTDMARRPRDVARYLESDQARLYELIWIRSVASQTEAAELERTTAEITAQVNGRLLDLRATGTVVKFDGFLKLYHEDQDDPEEDDDSRRLPAMSAGETLTKEKIDASQHFTEPPPRYSEASLVKRMEELGIGRPSTYASTLQVLRDRGYVRIDKKRLIPEDKGRVVVAFLESFFARYVEYDFTAALEEQLDRISNNEIDWKAVLADFWRGFIAAVDDIKDLQVRDVLDALNEVLGPHIFPPREDGGDPRQCPTCGTGQLSLKVGKFGAFIGCSNYPDCRFTRQLSVANGDGSDNGTRVLGQDPETGLEVSVRTGRFGPYLQLGEAKDGEKPKRASIPKGVALDEIELARALALLSLPREVGISPETGEPILAGIGRYGPYVQMGKTYANLEAGDDVLTIGLNRAVTLIAEKQAKGPRGRRFGSSPGRELGAHPTQGGPIAVKEGRYGPYVTHNKVNATLPSDIAPDTITLEQAVALIDARAAKGGGKPVRGAKAKAAREKEAAPAAKASKPAKAAKEPAAKTAKPKKSGAKAAKSAAGSGAERKAKAAK
jgi:DNA topoisomerase-1